jgi:hypothetical protein
VETKLDLNLLLISEGVDSVLAVLLKATRALLAVGLEAGRVLGTDTYAVADLDALLCLLADSDSLADDLVADAARIWGWTPA